MTIRLLIGNGIFILNHLMDAANIDKREHDKRNISKEKLEEICKKANPKKTPENGGIFLGGSSTSVYKANYAELIYNDGVHNVKVHIKNIFMYLPFLDSNLIRLLNEINESSFSTLADAMTWKDNSIQNFSHMTDFIYHYIESIKELELYAKKLEQKYRLKIFNL